MFKVMRIFCSLFSQALGQVGLSKNTIPSNSRLVFVPPPEYQDLLSEDDLLDFSFRISAEFGLSQFPAKADVIRSGYCATSIYALQRAGQLIQNEKVPLCVVCAVNLISVYKIAATNRKGLYSSTYPQPFGVHRDGNSRVESVISFVLTTPEFRSEQRLPTLGKFRSILAADFTEQMQQQKESGQKCLAQTLCMKEALKMANVRPEDVAYLEVHGSATKDGDVEEFTSVRDVYCSPSRRTELAIGCLTGTVGNVEAASGLLEVLKTILVLHFGVIPPNMNPQKPYEFDELCNISNLPNVTFPTTEAKNQWDISAQGPTLIGAVNSFGVGGDAAHIIVEVDDEVRASLRHFLEMERNIWCSDPSYSLSPPLSQLRQLPLTSLSNVAKFSITFPNGQHVQWIRPVDLSNIGDIANEIMLWEEEGEVVPRLSTLHPEGKGLNAPVIVTLRDVFFPIPTNAQKELELKLLEERAVLLWYNADLGLCCYRMDVFLVHSLGEGTENHVEGDEDEGDEDEGEQK